MDVVPYRVGVPKSAQSGLEKFEGYTKSSTMVLGMTTNNVILGRTQMNGVGEVMPSSTRMRAVLSTAKGTCITSVKKKVSWSYGILKHQSHTAYRRGLPRYHRARCEIRLV
jgi:hypothetical protein